MLYQTVSERDQFFADIEAGRRILALRSWADHAATTDVGIWGDEHALEAECAAIAAEAIHQRMCILVDEAAVLRTVAFRDAFARARQEPHQRLDRLLRSSSDYYAQTVEQSRIQPLPDDVDGWAKDVAKKIVFEIASRSRQ